jgi:hypothetical protein
MEKIIKILSGLIFFIFFYFFSSYFLENNFSNFGENYFKGLGYLLDEKFGIGFIFLVLRHFIVPFPLFYVLLISLNQSTKKILYKTLLIICVLITVIIWILFMYKFYIFIEDNIIKINRYIELLLTWSLRLLALFSAYNVSKIEHSIKNIYK